MLPRRFVCISSCCRSTPAIFATQGCILVKAGLRLQGRDVGGLRSPLIEATLAEIDGLRSALAAAGLPPGEIVSTD